MFFRFLPESLQQYRACGNLNLSRTLHLTYLCLTTVPRPWQITLTLKLLFGFTKMALAFIKTGYLLTPFLKIGNEKRSVIHRLRREKESS